jgi:hypothetical protein
MTKFIVSDFITLDDVIQAPGAEDEDRGRDAGRQRKGTGACRSGRTPFVAAAEGRQVAARSGRSVLPSQALNAEETIP